MAANGQLDVPELKELKALIAAQRLEIFENEGQRDFAGKNLKAVARLQLR